MCNEFRKNSESQRGVYRHAKPGVEWVNRRILSFEILAYLGGVLRSCLIKLKITTLINECFFVSSSVALNVKNSFTRSPPARQPLNPALML